jgi:RHS repeat-associated protein
VTGWMKLETDRSSHLPHHSRVPSEIMLIVNQPGRLAEIYTMKGQQEAQQELTLATYYYHNDHLGTPQVMTDGEQKVVWKASYDAFGLADIGVDEVENDLRFPGQYFDSETGLHYNYFRDYDPSLGRYLQSDPIGLDGGLNTYAYVLGNPIRYIDPLGLEVSICCRPAEIAAGLIDHCWVQTDTVSAGMGANPNVLPGQEYEGYGMPVQVTDHSNDTATSCTTMNNVDEQCVNDELEIGKPIGRFMPPINQCQSFAYGVVNKCRTGSQF